MRIVVITIACLIIALLVALLFKDLIIRPLHRRIQQEPWIGNLLRTLVLLT